MYITFFLSPSNSCNVSYNEIIFLKNTHWKQKVWTHITHESVLKEFEKG